MRRVALSADVTRSSEIAAAIDEAMRRHGRIDILHNNVGITEMGDPIEATEESWDRVMAVNLKSVFLACKHVLPVMKAQRKGAIVNISSLAAVTVNDYPVFLLLRLEIGAEPPDARARRALRPFRHPRERDHAGADGYAAHLHGRSPANTPTDEAW